MGRYLQFPRRCRAQKGLRLRLGTGREIAFKKLGPSLPRLFVVLNASDKNGELGKVSHLTASGLNQSLVFLENDFGLFVFIRSVDGYAIGDLCDAVAHNTMATNTALIILPLPVVVNDKQFERFCKEAGAQQLAFDPPYQTNALRVANRTLLIPKLMQLLKQQTTDWWLTQLNAVGVPCGPICTLDEVFDNPQIQARGMKIALDHEQLGKVPSVANPIKLSATPLQYTQAPPMLGQHTQVVLQDWLAMS